MVRARGRLGSLTIVVASVLTLVGCQSKLGSISGGKKTVLWNGKDFGGWVRFVGDPAIDVNDVWTIRDGVIYCKGRPNGYIRTKQTHENYRLHVEWRWVQEPSNSGVLLHASGPDQVWPKCIESQLKADSAGDFVLIGGTGITVEAVDHQDTSRRFVSIPKMAATSEKPAGQWNSYDIHCKGDTIRCYVNGVLQNEGTGATETSGWICLQSEGGPIEFRNIYLRPAD